jgi:hypothetical protein
MYNKDFVYLGAPPRELAAHLVALPCAGSNAVVHGIDVPCVANNFSARISLSAIAHVVADPEVCGDVDIVVGSATLHEWVDCAHVVLGTENVLSATQLRLGYRVSPTDICFYKADRTVDHLTAIFVVAVLLSFLTVWADWTKHLWERVQCGVQKQVWEVVSVAGYTVVADLLVVIININIFSAINDDQIVYDFTSGRLVPHHVLQLTAESLAFVASPIVGLGGLLALTIGQVLHVDTPPSEHPVFGWGVTYLETQPWWYRGFASCVIILLIYAVLVTVWWYGLKDSNGTYAAVLTSTLFVAHRSSPSVLVSIIHENRAALLPYTDVILVALRWSMQFMLLTCMQNNIPFDVYGTLSTQFTAACSLVTGGILVVTTGRDCAHVIDLLAAERCWRVLTAVSICIHAIVIYVIWFAAVFSIGGGLFSNSDALINKEALALRCGITATTLLLVLSLETSHHVGRPHSAAKSGAPPSA